MSYNRYPPAPPQVTAPRRNADANPASDLRHQTIAKANADRYRDQVYRINKTRDRDIERALQGA